MDGSKIKNVVLIVLLLTNAFLLGLLLLDHSEERAAEEEGWARLTEIFADSGIRLSGTVRRQSDALEQHSLRRDAEAERRAVEKLLGNLYFQDLGGNIYFYNGVNGQATFRGTGEFDIVMNAGVIATGDDPMQEAAGVLKKLGIDCEPANARVEASDTMTVVELPLAWRGAQVYNASVTFTFSSEDLILISGRRLPDAETGRAAGGFSPETLLMRFLRAVGEGGYVCSEVRELSCGYIMNVPVSGDAELVPVWRIGTDAGDYYFNGLTGREELLA